ncbi:efflux transporter outer membrane subunit [Sphingobium aquiterrae]|uniref:efflux transporter outer membrane subunit n=1 Tax=Sphingobium aquiterrae TaxID=2038656 RepID=UPI003015CDFC
MSVRGASLSLIVMLAGCAGPAVKTEKITAVQPAPGWRTPIQNSAPIDAQWWQGFGDPVLAGLVEKALAHNRDIAIAAARVREAQANVRLARSQLLPTLDAGAGAGRSRSVSAFGTPLEQNFAQPQLQTAYEIDLFGRLADSTSAARSAYLASEAARDTVRLAITSATASQYISLLGLDARLEIARKTLAARADSLRIATSRDQAGYAPKLELRQAQVEYDAAAQIIPQIEGAIARTEDSLSQLTGDVPGAIARGARLDALATPSIPDGLPSQLLDRRPDIAQAANQLAAADASLSAARKRFLPQIRLTGSAGAAFSSALVDPITIWSIGGSILAPLFEGGRLRAQADVAASQRDQAALAYQRTVLTSFREVEDALTTVTHLDAQMTLARHQRDTLVDTLRLATNRYREGYSAYLEQLDAQRGLLNAELVLAGLQTDVLTARVQLYQAMGGGWSAASQAAATQR